MCGLNVVYEVRLVGWRWMKFFDVKMEVLINIAIVFWFFLFLFSFNCFSYIICILQ